MDESRWNTTWTRQDAGVLASLAAILFLSAFLRLASLADNPRGFFCDEASVGYDAYSVLHTQRDQYGNLLPLYARSFGDYDEFLYRYLTVPAVAWFGLNEFATRLPAAVAGVLTVACAYQLGTLLWTRQIGLLAALLLGISPWHIHFSRIAFRAILFPLCFCAGLSLFLTGLRRPRYLLASAIIFALTLYTYSAARLFVPLFVMIVAGLYRATLQRHSKVTFCAGALLMALAVPAVLFWLTPEGMARAEATLHFSLRQNVSSYASYFSPQFLFIYGDPRPRHNARPFGELYPFELFSVLAGVVMLCKPAHSGNIAQTTELADVQFAMKRSFSYLRAIPKEHALVLFWLALYPLPAALTDPDTALRAIIGAPLFALISAYGLRAIYCYAREYLKACVIAGSIAVLLGAGAFIFVYHYYARYPQESAIYWQYGMRESIRYAETHHYQRVWVSDQFLLPHIFILFYTKYPPELYQANPMNEIKQNHWFYTNYTLGKYHIGAVGLSKVRFASEGPLLLILPSQEYDREKNGQSRWRKVNQINAPRGLSVITLVEVDVEG